MPGADAEDTPCLLQEGYLLGQTTHSPEREQEAGDGPVVAQVLLMRMLALPGSFWGLHLLPWSGCCRGWRSHSRVSVPHWVSASLCRSAPSLAETADSEGTGLPISYIYSHYEEFLRTGRRQEPTLAQVVGGPKSQTSSHLRKLVHILCLTNLSSLIWPKSSPWLLMKQKAEFG